MRKLEVSGPAYSFWGFSIPQYMLEVLNRYIEHGHPPGDFLSAVICNDLKNAIIRADDHNVVNLRAYIAYLHNEAPAECWGSYENMRKWIKLKQTEVNHVNPGGNSRICRYPGSNP